MSPGFEIAQDEGLAADVELDLAVARVRRLAANIRAQLAEWSEESKRREAAFWRQFGGSYRGE